MIQDEIELYNNICQGKNAEAALITIQKKYRLPLYQFAYRITKCEFASQTLVQDAFIGLWKRGKEQKPVSSVGAFLYSCIKKRSKNFFRDNKKFHDMKDIHELEEWPNSDEDKAKQIQEELREVIFHLPSKENNLIEKQLQGYEYKDIAREMNLSIKQTEKVAFKARRLIKNRFNKII